MVKNHLKTIAAPEKWPVKRKSRVFVLRPKPGPHSLKNNISLNFLLTEILRVAKTKKEAKLILHNREILIDGRRIKSIYFPVGLFDVISINDIKKTFRIVLDRQGKLAAMEISDKEAHIKPYKITCKNQVGKKIQLNLFDGRNILVDKNDYKVGDTIIIDLLKNKITEHIKLDKGNTMFLTGGKHKGTLGIVEDIISNKIIYKIRSNEVYETLKKYAFVVGTDKPIIKMHDER